MDFQLENGMKTLIVEDDPASCLLLEEILSGYGECQAAPAGERALELFEQALADGRPFDLICLDIMLPGLDGQQVLQTIRRREQQLERESKIIMITALSSTAALMSAFKAGATSYLVKPVRKSNLLLELHKFGLV
jgi:two-component system chemotaxis response regulator CheY